MDDLISRQAAIDAGVSLIKEDEWIEDDYDIGFSDGVAYVIQKIRELPSTQPEITRCHECVKRRTLDCPMGITVFDAPPSDGYCYKSERRN